MTDVANHRDRGQKITFTDKRGREIILDKPSGYLMLSVGTVASPQIVGLNVPQRYSFSGHSFIAKDELHISLTGREIGQAAFGKNQRDVEGRLQILLSQHSFEFALTPNGIKMIQEGDKRSIIAHVNWTDAQQFYTELSRTFLDSKPIAIPPLHITVMVSENAKRGIGVPTFERLSELRPVNLASLE
jgi:hypothetical protein